MLGVVASQYRIPAASIIYVKPEDILAADPLMPVNANTAARQSQTLWALGYRPDPAFTAPWAVNAKFTLGVNTFNWTGGRWLSGLFAKRSVQTAVTPSSVGAIKFPTANRIAYLNANYTANPTTPWPLNVTCVVDQHMIISWNGMTWEIVATLPEITDDKLVYSAAYAEWKKDVNAVTDLNTAGYTAFPTWSWKQMSFFINNSWTAINAYWNGTSFQTTAGISAKTQVAPGAVVTDSLISSAPIEQRPLLMNFLYVGNPNGTWTSPQYATIGGYKVWYSAAGWSPGPSNVVGTTNIFGSNNAARVVTPHASTAIGDVMVVFGSILSTATLQNPASGWTVIHPNTIAGTLGMACWYRVRQSGDTTYSFPISATANSLHTCTTLRGVTNTGMNVGTIGTRAGSGGTFTTTAPSITTSVPSLIMCFASERTTATETGISSIDNGFKQSAWYAHGAGGIESNCIATKLQETAGVVGQTSVVYQISQASNGMAFQLALPLV